MKEKVIIRSPKPDKLICEVILDEDWNFYDLFEQMTDEQFIEFKNSFPYFFNHHFSSCFSEPLTLKDIEEEEDFMEFLNDYYEDTYMDDDGLFQIVDITSPAEDKNEEMTIRQLYELAKEHGIEDMPLSITYFCNDDWYSFTNRTFTKDMFNTETAEVCFGG
jgi:hypothetical protein